MGGLFPIYKKLISERNLNRSVHVALNLRLVALSMVVLEVEDSGGGVVSSYEYAFFNGIHSLAVDITHYLGVLFLLLVVEEVFRADFEEFRKAGLELRLMDFDSRLFVRTYDCILTLGEVLFRKFRQGFRGIPLFCATLFRFPVVPLAGLLSREYGLDFFRIFRGSFGGNLHKGSLVTIFPRLRNPFRNRNRRGGSTMGGGFFTLLSYSESLKSQYHFFWLKIGKVLKTL